MAARVRGGPRAARSAGSVSSDACVSSLTNCPLRLTPRLAPIYLISGDEPLTAGEAADAVRAAARKAGFTERIVFSVDRSFAWDELRQAAQEMSLFAERRLFELRMPSGQARQGRGAARRPRERTAARCAVPALTGKLDAKTSDSAWVRAIERAGVWVRVWPVEPRGAAGHGSRAVPARSGCASRPAWRNRLPIGSKVICSPPSKSSTCWLCSRTARPSTRPRHARHRRQRPL